MEWLNQNLFKVDKKPYKVSVLLTLSKFQYAGFYNTTKYKIQVSKISLTN